MAVFDALRKASILCKRPMSDVIRSSIIACVSEGEREHLLLIGDKKWTIVKIANDMLQDAPSLPEPLSVMRLVPMQAVLTPETKSQELAKFLNHYVLAFCDKMVVGELVLESKTDGQVEYVVNRPEGNIVAGSKLLVFAVGEKSGNASKPIHSDVNIDAELVGLISSESKPAIDPESLKKAVRIGELAESMKKKVGIGKWHDWMGKNLKGMTPHTIQNYRRVAAASKDGILARAGVQTLAQAYKALGISP
jgi:hypothetical protein